MMNGPNYPKIGNNMGYYTYFSIAFEGDEKEIEEFKKDLLEVSKDEDGNVDDSLKELLDYSGCEAKLYDLDDWICSVAPKYPNVLVFLNGDGEESDDLWETRWKGEFYEVQKSIIPPFQTPELLSEYERKHNNN